MRLASFSYDKVMKFWELYLVNKAFTGVSMGVTNCGGILSLSFHITWLQWALEDPSLGDSVSLSPSLGRCGLGNRIWASQIENEAEFEFSQLGRLNRP